MFFKRAGFLFFFLTVLGAASPAWGQLEQSECIRIIKRYGPSLFKNTLTINQREGFFDCLHDAVELMLFPTPEEKRDYYTKQELIDFLASDLFGYSLKTSRSLVTQFFAFKKLLLGGKDDQLSVQEVKWAYNLMDEFERVISYLQEDFPLLTRAFSGKGVRQELSEEKFQRLSDRLSSSLSFLGKAFVKEGFFYRLGDLRKTSDYLHQAGLITNKNRKTAKQFSIFLHEWGNGVFGSNALIKGDRWEPFLDSFHSLLSQFLYYGFYVAGKDLSHPRIFTRFLKSIQFFLSSLEYVEEHPSGNKGFPLRGLDRMFQAIVGDFLNHKTFQSSSLGSFLKSLARERGMPWVLMSRALTCFSLPPRKADCSVHWGDSSTAEVVKYQFPDGNFYFYENRQEWRPTNGWREFEIYPDQIRYLKDWLSYWSYNLLSFDRGSLPSYKGQQSALAGWMNGFFGQDLRGRIIFNRHNSQASVKRLSRQFMENDLFVKLVFASYPSQRQTPDDINFRDSAFHLSPELWEKAVGEFSPVFTLLYGNGFQSGLKSRFISLLDYADHFLNTANYNGLLDYGELMDLAFHLPSAAASGKIAYPYVIKECAPNLEASCVSQVLVSQKETKGRTLYTLPKKSAEGSQEEILSHTPYLQSYLSGYSERFDEITQKLLPEKITGFEDLVVFFLFAQMIETNFYFLDENRSFSLEMEEIFPLMRALAPRVQSAVPFIHNERQALAFLIYSAYHQTIPFLRKDPREPFQSLEFVNWTLYPEKWKGLGLSRTRIFSLAADFYDVHFQGN